MMSSESDIKRQMWEAEQRRMADKKWLEENPRGVLLNGKRVEYSLVEPPREQPRREAPRPRQQPAAPDRQAAERAAETRRNELKMQELRTTIEQIGGQIAGVQARVRSAEVTKDWDGKQQWVLQEARLKKLQAEKQAELDQLRGKRAA